MIDAPTSPSATEMMMSVALFGTTALVVQERASVELSRETCGSQQRTFETRDSEIACRSTLLKLCAQLQPRGCRAAMPQSDSSPAEGRRTVSMFARATRPWATAQSAEGASGRWRASPTQTTGRASTPSCQAHPPLSPRQTLVRNRSSESIRGSWARLLVLGLTSGLNTGFDPSAADLDRPGRQLHQQGLE